METGNAIITSACFLRTFAKEVAKIKINDDQSDAKQNPFISQKNLSHPNADGGIIPINKVIVAETAHAKKIDHLLG